MSDTPCPRKNSLKLRWASAPNRNPCAGSSIAGKLAAVRYLGWGAMKYTTYSRYLPELADTINLQGLLDQLADFLLQSGFAGGAYSHPFWGEFGEDDADRSLD